MFSEKVIVLKVHNYGGKRRQKDEEYVITNLTHARLLISIKKIRLSLEKSERKKMPIEKEKKKKSSRSRVYGRKDLIAEDITMTKARRKIKKNSSRTPTISSMSQEQNRESKETEDKD